MEDQNLIDMVGCCIQAMVTTLKHDTPSYMDIQAMVTTLKHDTPSYMDARYMMARVTCGNVELAHQEAATVLIAEFSER